MATQLSSNLRLKNLRGNIDKVHSKRNLDNPSLPIIPDESDCEVEKKIKEITNYTIREIKYSEVQELKLLLEKFNSNSNGTMHHHNHKSRSQDNHNYDKENKNDTEKKRVRDTDSSELLPEPKKKSSVTNEMNSPEEGFVCRRALPFTKSKDLMDIEIPQKDNSLINSHVKENNAPPKTKLEIKAEPKYSESNGVHSSSYESQNNNSTRNNNNSNNNNNHSNSNHQPSSHTSGSSSSSSSSSSGSGTTPTTNNHGEESNTTPSKKLQKKNPSFPIASSDYTEKKQSIKKENSTELPRSSYYDKLTPVEIAMKLENEGRELKHIADGKTPGVSLTKSERAIKYLQAGLKFLQSLRHREDDPKEKINIGSFYRTTAKFFTDCAKLFEDWQRFSEITSLTLYITLCYECQAVLLYRRSCKIIPVLKKKKDDRLKDAKLLKGNLASNNVDAPSIQKYVNDSILFYDELADVLNFHDAWDKAMSKSKSLSNFTLPPILSSIEELVEFIQRSLDDRL